MFIILLKGQEWHNIFSSTLNEIRPMVFIGVSRRLKKKNRYKQMPRWKVGEYDIEGHIAGEKRKYKDFAGRL